MSDKRSGALRWGKEERRTLKEYLEKGRIDLSKVQVASYLKQLREREDVWSRHPQKNFNQNVRRAVAMFEMDRDLSGARRRQSSPEVERDRTVRFGRNRETEEAEPSDFQGEDIQMDGYATGDDEDFVTGGYESDASRESCLLA